MKALFTRKSIRGSISLEQRSLPTRAWAPGELYGECGVRGGGWIVPSTSVVGLLSVVCSVEGTLGDGPRAGRHASF